MLVGDVEEGAILYSSPSASENSSKNFFEHHGRRLARRGNTLLAPRQISGNDGKLVKYHDRAGMTVSRDGSSLLLYSLGN